MIFDSISNASLYYGVSAKIKKALQFLEAYDPAKHEAGKRIDIDDDMFALQPVYETKAKAECLAEAHRKYIDVMSVVDGDEAVGYMPLSDVTVTQEYKDDIEALLGKFPDSTPFIPFKKGCFAIFFPEDGHVTGAYGKTQGKVKKVVVKVKI